MAVASDQMKQERRPPKGAAASRKADWLALAGLSAVYLFSVLYQPEAPGPDGSYFTICGFKNATGLPGPACGLTHSFCELGKGNLHGALGFNLMGPPLFLLSVAYWLRSACLIGGLERPARAFDDFVSRYRIVWAFVLSFVVFGAARIFYLVLK
jgi:hypothetical protein